MNYTQNKCIDAEAFEQLIVGAAAKLRENVQTVNDLNVFPIPDGDTGDNMLRTINGGILSMHSAEDTVAKKAKALSDGMLMSARGNSGVILSQLFRGVALGLTEDTADLKQLAGAFQKGVECGYKAVVQPVEGTILTVSREATAEASAKLDENSTLETFVNDFIDAMQVSLENTPNLLAVLKEAGVVDSGGAGLLYMAEGARSVIRGGEGGAHDLTAATVAKDLDFSKFNENSVMEFGYCTEVMLQLQKIKVDVNAFDVQEIVSYLETIGDSIVAFKVGTVVKIHVHTMTPYKVLEFCQKFGEYLTVKIENMTLQHNEVVARKQDDLPKVKRARRKFGLCAVAFGEGLIEVFKELGADVVIEGGQSRNPSIREFLDAFDEIDADNIFVLPNNGNIILAAEQAAECYEKSNVIVVQSKNLGQAYAALQMLDYSSDDADAISEQMKSDMAGVVTGMVTVSVRDANLNGVDIKKGAYIGFTDKTMLASDSDKTATLLALCEKLAASEREFMTVVYGKGVTDEEKDAVRRGIAEKYKNMEMYEIEGGQDVYDFIVIME